MPAGTVTPAEGRTFRDPETNVEIRQLTNHRAHSHHMYFTNSGLWDGGERLLVGSHRGNASNFYSVELATGDSPTDQIPPGGNGSYVSDRSGYFATTK